MGKWCAGDRRGVAERPVGLRGAGQRAVVGFGAFCEGAAMAARRFAKAPRWLLGVLLYSQENAVYDDSYFQKSAVLGDFYLRKSAELG